MDTVGFQPEFVADTYERSGGIAAPEVGKAISSPAYDAAKRAMDIVLAVVLIVAAAPLLLCVAVAVWLTSSGPVVFRQRRLGLDGREFWCFKFRTMRRDAEEILRRSPDLQRQFEEGYKIKNDPRVTPVGDMLRSTSLDELPQLWNILRGDISLVGPRPIVPSELAKYGPYAPALLRVKPGLSGLWQVSGRSDTSYTERVRLDMQYIHDRCLRLDLAILWRTIAVVTLRRGAC